MLDAQNDLHFIYEKVNLQKSFFFIHSTVHWVIWILIALHKSRNEIEYSDI